MTTVESPIPWWPSDRFRQGNISRQPAEDLQDPFSPTEDRHNWRPRTLVLGSQNNSWGYQTSGRGYYNDLAVTSPTAFSPSASTFRRRSRGHTASDSPRTRHPLNIPHPLPEVFEAPPLFLLLLHTLFCGLAYLALYVTALLATGRTLFWTRVLVGAGSGIMGFSLSITLLELAQGLLEAATWATLIHQSNVEGMADTGMKLRDLCVQANEPKGMMSAMRLIWGRRKNATAMRQNQDYYDGRWWTGYILLFLFCVGLSGCLPFIFGRAVDIATISQVQNTTFEEVLVAADLSLTDLANAAAIEPAFTSDKMMLFTWSLEPFSAHGGLPSPRALQWGNEMVYFSEVIPRQLQPNGTGFGSFSPDSDLIAPQNTSAINSIQHDVNSGLDPGAILRFPRWGIRIHCERIPDLGTNLIPFSPNQRTYLFTPRSVVQSLFDSFGLSMPPAFNQPLNITKAMQANDTFPSTLSADSIALAAVFWPNGVSTSMKSTPVDDGSSGNGFATLENVLIRLNNTYAPQGTFPYLNPVGANDATGKPTFIGYDAAVCLELYEPWILNVYIPSVGPPSTMDIQSKVDLNNYAADVAPPKRKSKGIPSDAKRMINSTGLNPVYVIGHENSVNQIIKDNGRDSFYVPSPTLVSFTDGSGPSGYTQFSAERYANARAIADASNVLPYFAGSGKLVARRYKDQVIAIASLNKFELIFAIGVIFATGFTCAWFVPRLPLGVPRRGFNLYSWILAFHAKEIEIEGDEEIVHGMQLDNLQGYAGDATLRYRVVSKFKDELIKMDDNEGPQQILMYSR